MTREQQIYLAELFAIPLLIGRAAAHLQGRDLVLFVDNEGAVASVIRGSTSAPDARILMETIHILQLYLDCRIWFEWIDSKSNPADGFSRDGVSCSFAQSQAMELEDIHSAPHAGTCPWAFAKALLAHQW